MSLLVKIKLRNLSCYDKITTCLKLDNVLFKKVFRGSSLTEGQ